MILYGFMLTFLFIIIKAQNNNNNNNNNVNKAEQSVIRVAVAEYEPKNSVDVNDSHNETKPTTTERTLIRVTRLNTETDETIINTRQRRQIMDGEEILETAKKVAIWVIVSILLCFLCCFVTIVIICVKCCCKGNSHKRNPVPAMIQVPQPIYIQTSPSGYQPHYYQQQAPQQAWNSITVESPETRPMLPQPSAPPPPNPDSSNEYAPPPPYERLYAKC